MHPISDVLGTSIETISERRRQFRASQIDRWGFAADCDCAECGDAGYLPDRPDVPCQSCETGRAIAQRMRRDLDWNALCPFRFRGFRLESHPNREAVREVEAWLDTGAERGQNLLLSGPIGTGKTGLAVAALRELFVSGRTVRLGTVPDLMQALRPQDPTRQPGQDASIHDLQRVQVLLLDDLGAERPTEWQAEQLYMVINGRYERGLPTIVTTNRDDFAVRIGSRAMSRFIEDVAAVAVLGADLRRHAS